MNTSICIRQSLQLLPQIVNVWVDAPLSQISSQVCKLSGWYSFKASPCVGYTTY